MAGEQENPSLHDIGDARRMKQEAEGGFLGRILHTFQGDTAPGKRDSYGQVDAALDKAEGEMRQPTLHDQRPSSPKMEGVAPMLAKVFSPLMGITTAPKPDEAKTRSETYQGYVEDKGGDPRIGKMEETRKRNLEERPNQVPPSNDPRPWDSTLKVLEGEENSKGAFRDTSRREYTGDPLTSGADLTSAGPEMARGAEAMADKYRQRGEKEPLSLRMLEQQHPIAKTVRDPPAAAAPAGPQQFVNEAVREEKQGGGEQLGGDKGMAAGKKTGTDELPPWFGAAP